ncbi:unnamed protein product [Rotaria sordida]|uniref:Uncharacterized protein n=1 Tax=Rotaria sordida TaxID=392033 RepID=A0A814L6F0_9BILA|nr:unnamed protein product [Rotaria sordida]
MVSTVGRCFVFVLFSLTVRVKSQFCHGMSQYDRCSPNSACTCFYIAGAIGIGVCGYEFADCSELVPCEGSNNLCLEPNRRCVHHPRCHDLPVCYPVPSFNRQLCPPISITNTTTATTIPTKTTTTTTTQQLVIPNISVNATWAQNGITVAGGRDQGSATNQLSWPFDLLVDDDDQTMIITDAHNHRIIQWKIGETHGQVVAGGHGQGNRLEQLHSPTDVLIDKETDSLIICDWQNRRVVRWSRRSGTTQGEILVDNIRCWGLAMDVQKYLYISDTEKDEVRRYQIGDKEGTLVVGGHGQGADLNQLNWPKYIFVDQQQAVYVSDSKNHRVMKWNKDAAEGTVVAGGHGEGKALTQLSEPYGLFVDMFGTIYVADSDNNRVMRWPKGATQGTVIVGGNGQGAGANQFKVSMGLSFDRHGNLYVVDEYNHRIQQFSIE